MFQLCVTFGDFKNILAIIENLFRETKNLNFDISKISLRKNLINLKPLPSLLMEHVGLTEQLFRQCKVELNIFFYYLTLKRPFLNRPCVKRPIQKSIHHAHLKSCWKSIHHVYIDFETTILSDAFVCRCSSKQVFLKISQISEQNTVLESFFKKVAAVTLLKETPTQFFSCESQEIFKHIFF